MSTKLSQEQQSKIVKLYSEGNGSPTIADMIGVHPSSVYRYLKKYNVAMRDNKHKGHKYSFIEDYFENIDSPEKAYWMGYIWGDGHITNYARSSGKIHISIKESDGELLSVFANDIKFSGPIHTYHALQGYNSNTVYNRITLTSDKMFNDLKSLGLTERKSNTCMFPNIFKDYENPYCRDFIRGLYDSDGSISVTTTKSKYQYRLRLCGTDDILQNVLSFLRHNDIPCNAIPYHRHFGDKVKQLDIGGTNILYRTLFLIYADATRYMDRKYERFLQFCNDISRPSSKVEG